MADIFSNNVVTEEALFRLNPSLERPIKLEFCAGKYNPGDELSIIFVVSKTDQDKEFWAYFARRDDNDKEYNVLRKLPGTYLKCYRFCEESLPRRSIVFHFDRQGRVTAYSNGAPITSEDFPDGLRMDVPYLP